MISFDYSALIRDLLINNYYIHNLIEDKVFPIVADAGTTFPFVVYRRSAYYKGNPTKDDFDNMFSVELAILASNYKDSIEILERVIDVLDNYRTNDIEINVTNTYEEFSEDTYIQKINLNIKYND